jgi:hypothetical protein
MANIMEVSEQFPYGQPWLVDVSTIATMEEANNLLAATCLKIEFNCGGAMWNRSVDGRHVEFMQAGYWINCDGEYCCQMQAYATWQEAFERVCRWTKSITYNNFALV